MYIVETKDLYFRYPDGTAVLKGINFKVKKEKWSLYSATMELENQPYFYTSMEF